MKKNIALVVLLLICSALNVSKAQSHDNKGCALNKKFDPAKESYTCPVCIMQIEKAKAEKKQREAGSAKEKKDDREEKKAAADKAVMEELRKKKEETEKNKSPKDSTEKKKPVENPKIN